jgi:hypothetical protein
MNRPNYVSWRHPVAAGVTIRSGQIISAKRNVTTGRTEWVLGYDPATSARHMIAFALDDSDDADVLAAGNLVGVPCVPEYGIQTGYIKDAVTFIEGDEVTHDGVTGDVMKAVSTSIVIGRVAMQYAAPVDLGATFTPSAVAANQSPGMQGGSYVAAKHSEASPSGLSVVRIELLQPFIKA